jgi:hypothetical protein
MIRPKTTLLFEHPDPVSCHAALAGSRAHRAGGPGLVMDLHTLRGHANHPGTRQFPTLLHRFGPYLAVLFCDHSAIIGLDIGQGQLAAHPTLYHLRESLLSPQSWTFFVRRGKNPLRALVDAPLDAALVFKDHTDPAVQYLSPSLDSHPNLATWFSYLDQDLSTLLAAPLPWCGIPYPAQPTRITPSIQGELGLPEAALGHPLTVPTWLPQERENTTTLRAYIAYYQDFVNWTWITYGHPGPATQVRCSLTSATPHTYPSMREASLTIQRDRAQLQPGHPPTLSASPTFLLADPTRWAPPLSYAFGFSFFAAKEYRHRVQSTLTQHLDPKPVSAHERLSLLERFGTGNPIT